MGAILVIAFVIACMVGIAEVYEREAAKQRALTAQLLATPDETGFDAHTAQALALLECECPPCPGRGYDGHRMNHCAECCFGTGVDADPACPLHGYLHEVAR